MKFNVSASRSVLALIAALAGTTAANAAIIQYSATLNGPNEAPPVNSAGVGTSLLTYDTVARTYRIEITFSGLTGTTSACHIHGATAAPFAGTAGVMSPTPTYPGFLNGVRAGSYDRTFDMTLPGSWGSGFLTARGGSTAAAETFFAATGLPKDGGHITEEGRADRSHGPILGQSVKTVSWCCWIVAPLPPCSAASPKAFNSIS